MEPLSTRGVHVWSVALDVPPHRLTALESSLSDPERARAARFHFRRDRDRFSAARGTLREILGAYLGRPPGEVDFAYGPQGKPRLAPSGPESPGGPQGLGGDRDAPLDFNLSHAAGLALVALVRGRPVGVDVEAHRPLGDLLAMARSVMTGAELAAFQALPEEARAPAFFTLWTRKEAYMKATGAGFTLPPQSFAVQGLAGAGWTLRDLPVGGGFAACVAVRGPVDPLRYASWPPGGP
jgi:4'-phosphopantetheinyl transferase